MIIMMRYGESLGTLDWETDELYLLRSIISRRIASDPKYGKDISDGVFIRD